MASMLARGSLVVGKAARGSSSVATAAAAAALAAVAVNSNSRPAKTGEDCAEPAKQAWTHYGALASHDHASIRRGFQVYRQVCSTCHSIERIFFRELVGVTHTEAEMKKLAMEYEVEDGPDNEGNMYERPAKLYDRIPGPYPNKNAGRAANGGSYPPDLSLMVKARDGHEDYIYALLTGYMDHIPAGREGVEGTYYNPYFEGGGFIKMPPPLQDGQVEYEDGTPATVSQMAKDVVEFLSWTAEPELDTRKQMGLRYLTIFAVLIGFTGYYKRLRWSPIKSAQLSYVD